MSQPISSLCWFTSANRYLEAVWCLYHAVHGLNDFVCFCDCVASWVIGGFRLCLMGSPTCWLLWVLPCASFAVESLLGVGFVALFSYFVRQVFGPGIFARPRTMSGIPHKLLCPGLLWVSSTVGGVWSALQLPLHGLVSFISCFLFQSILCQHNASLTSSSVFLLVAVRLLIGRVSSASSLLVSQVLSRPLRSSRSSGSTLLASPCPTAC